MDIYTCPHCGTNNCVPAYGDEDSPVLLVADVPGDIEIVQGIPLIGRTGTILRQMLAKMGWDLSQFRVMNLWNHEPNKNEDCFMHGKELVLKEILGEPETDQQQDPPSVWYPNRKRAVLLIGADVAKAFLTNNVSDVCGMQTESIYFSVDVLMACYNPAIVFHSVAGEVELALKKFVSRIGEFYE